MEQEDAARWIIVQQARKMLPDRIAKPATAKPLAFQMQERDLIQWIDRPQMRIELEAIDDRERGTEPDVLRPQVAVTIDNKSSVNPIDEDWRAVFEKSSLNGSILPCGRLK